jgi:hypothetical protein
VADPTPKDKSHPAKEGWTNVPPYGWVRPVRSRSGQILYYADDAGRRIGGTALTGPGSGGTNSYTERPGSGNYNGQTRTYEGAGDAKTAAKRAADRSKRQDPATIAAANEKRAQATEVDQLNQGYAWIDGKRVRFVGKDPDTGNPLYTLNGAGDPNDGGNPYQLTKPSAYGALDTDLVDQNTRFVMSNGTQTFADGSHNQRTNPGWGSADAADRHYTQRTGTNFMTVGNGLTWLTNLSVKDPDAYQAMVDKLHDAGYLSDPQYEAAAGGYSSVAGSAFAKAATDLSVVNATDAGATLALDQFLKQRGDANAARKKDATAAAYVPTERSYTDPEAIKAAAKSEAESFLGRHLSDAEEAELVTHFRGLETAVFDAVDAAGVQGQNATFTQPNPTGQIDAFVEGPGREQEGANYRAAQYGQALKRLFGVATGG